MTVQMAYDAGLLAIDLVHDGSGLVPDDGLQTPIIMSLFTDAPATREELHIFGKPEDDRRGFWGDAFPVVPGDRWGSKLWLLDGLPVTEELIEDARRFAEESLQWLIDDGVLSSTGVETSLYERGDGVSVVAIAVAPVRVGEAAPAFQALYDATTGGTL